MGVLSAVESAWTARFINAAGLDLEPREDAFPCLRLIEHIATRTTDVREAAMLGFSQHCGTGYEKRWTGSSLHVGPSSSPAGRYSRSRRIVGRLSQTRRPSRQALGTSASPVPCVNQDFNSRRAYRENNVHHRQPSISEIARSFPGSGLRLLTTSHCLS